MVSKQQRERELARAKWERQLTRRQLDAAKTRRRGLLLGALLGAVALGLLGWLVWQTLRTDETPGEPTVVVPNPSVSIPGQLDPSNLFPTVSGPTTPIPPSASTPTIGQTP